MKLRDIAAHNRISTHCFAIAEKLFGYKGDILTKPPTKRAKKGKYIRQQLITMYLGPAYTDGVHAPQSNTVDIILRNSNTVPADGSDGGHMGSSTGNAIAGNLNNLGGNRLGVQGPMEGERMQQMSSLGAQWVSVVLDRPFWPPNEVCDHSFAEEVHIAENGNQSSGNNNK